MKLYRLTATLKSPLMIRRERQSYAPAALDYLPGSTLRGALAAKYLRLGGSPEDRTFRSLFVDQPIHFPNLLATNQPDVVPRVLPATAISCKRHPGFLGEDGHGVNDSLVATTVAKITKHRIRDDFWLCRHSFGVTRICHSEMTPFAGVWNSEPAAPRKFELSMQYRRHTGIDRATGTVASSIFFISQAIDAARSQPDQIWSEEPQRLAGTIYLENEQIKILAQLIDGAVFAGGSRSRGFGETELTLSEIDAFRPDIAQWDTRFRKKLAECTGDLIRTEGVYFTVKLDSHAILVDKFLRSLWQFVPDFPNVELVKRSAQAAVIRGWQYSSGLPKPDDVGIAMGSLFLFRYTGEDTTGLEQYLADITVKGVGLRREDGFGRISICEPLHVIEEVI